MRLVHFAAVVVLSSPMATGLAMGCGSGNDTDGASGPTAGTAGTNSGGAGSSSTYTTTGSGSVPTSIVECQGHVYACGDLADNDGDGLIDSQDPDCLGPCDDTEDSYFGGIPGQNNAPCKQDCYFDQDTGPGNDGCYWNHACDPHEVAPDYYPETQSGAGCEYDQNASTPGTSASCDELYAEQAQVCYDYCGPLTPNGCDCFGCCELPAGGGSYVWLGSVGPDNIGSCDIASVADPTKCHPCLPVAACLNTCGTCELCIGKTELPPECFPDAGTTGAGGGGSSQCGEGVQVCGLEGQEPCAANFYCITGCCIYQPT